MGPYAQAEANRAYDTKATSVGSQVSMTDPELLPTMLFQAFRTRDCNHNTGREDLKARLAQLLVLESPLTLAEVSLQSAFPQVITG